MTITIPLGQPVPADSIKSYRKQLRAYKGVTSVVITDTEITATIKIMDGNEHSFDLVCELASMESYHRKINT